MKRTHLTQQQRYYIQAMLEQGYGKQDIAKRLNKHPSTIGHEIERNSSDGIYHAENAQVVFQKVCCLKMNFEFRDNFNS